MELQSTKAKCKRSWLATTFHVMCRMTTSRRVSTDVWADELPTLSEPQRVGRNSSLAQAHFVHEWKRAVAHRGAQACSKCKQYGGNYRIKKSVGRSSRALPKLTG